MTIKRVTTGTAVLATLLFGFSTAHADKPLSVECDLLASAISDTDDFLDNATNVQFPNLGQLVSQAKKDDVLFGQLSGLILLFSGGAIDFTDAKQVVPTIAKCGLVPHLIAEIDD